MAAPAAAQEQRQAAEPATQPAALEPKPAAAEGAADLDVSAGHFSFCRVC